MRTLSVILLSAMLLLPYATFAGKPESFLNKIQKELKAEILEKEDRKFSPEIYVYGTDTPGDWCAVVNDDYLRGVVCIFEAADMLPAITPAPPWYESREFGFIAGVLTSAIIVYLLK